MTLFVGRGCRAGRRSRPSATRAIGIDDPYLRFWLAFVGPSMAAIERGCGDLAVAKVEAGWSAWRRRAIKPLIRGALTADDLLTAWA